MATTNKMRVWNVRVHRGGFSRYIGTVNEKSEELARAAALSQYSTDENDTAHGIGPDDEFDVSEAS